MLTIENVVPTNIQCPKSESFERNSENIPHSLDLFEHNFTVFYTENGK